MKKGPEKDYYSILGAGEDDSREEIERRYKRLAQQHHPDRGGDEEEMKSLNEAWRVLGDDTSRRAYDAGRAQRRRYTYQPVRPASSPPAQIDALSGRLLGAMLCVMLGLVLLFLVKVHYILFLWPLGLLALLIVLFGVLMAHGALTLVRASFAPTHPARRFAWAQEAAFWSCVCGGAYGVYLLLAQV
jgi:hypothetical protein